MASPETTNNSNNETANKITTRSPLPAELVYDIVCYVISAHYWSYFVKGQIIYHNSKTPHISASIQDDDSLDERLTNQEWDPVTAMAGINVIFRDQTLRVASKLLGIPRAVDGSLLERPRKVTGRLYLLYLHLNFNAAIIEEQPLVTHPLLDPSTGPIYFPSVPPSASNPWNDAPKLMLYVRVLLANGYISKSVYLRAYIALLVGRSALQTVSFGEVVRTTRERGAEANTDTGRGSAALALELLNRIIPPLMLYSPKQACAHLLPGIFCVAYSLHTLSAICGIVGVITSCTKLMLHLRAVESITGIDEDRRRSLQTATRACTMSLKQLQTCESSSYHTYRALGPPSEPPPWPNHIITHAQILEALKLAGPENLFLPSIRWALLRVAVIWTLRVEVPGLDLVFPDELWKWKEGTDSFYQNYNPNSLRNPISEGEELKKDGRLWGNIDCGHWSGTREEFLELWMSAEQKLIQEFGLEELDYHKDNDEEEAQ